MKYEIFVYHEKFKSIENKTFSFDSFNKIKKAFSLLVFDGFKIKINCFDILEKKEVVSLLSMIERFSFDENDDIESIIKKYEDYLENVS